MDTEPLKYEEDKTQIEEIFKQNIVIAILIA